MTFHGQEGLGSGVLWTLCSAVIFFAEFLWTKGSLGQGSLGPRLQLLQSVLDALPRTSESTYVRTYLRTYVRIFLLFRMTNWPRHLTSPVPAYVRTY